MSPPPRTTRDAKLDSSNPASTFATESSSSWFVSQGGKTEGPLSAQRITQLIRWGKISKRAYLCDGQLSSWVSIRRTAFGAIFAPHAVVPMPESEVVYTLGSLRGGPWRLSTRAAQRLSGLLAALSVAAGALQLASGLAMTRHTVAPASVRSSRPTLRWVPASSGTR